MQTNAAPARVIPGALLDLATALVRIGLTPDVAAQIITPPSITDYEKLNAQERADIRHAFCRDPEASRDMALWDAAFDRGETGAQVRAKRRIARLAAEGRPKRDDRRQRPDGHKTTRKSPTKTKRSLTDR